MSAPVHAADQPPGAAVGAADGAAPVLRRLAFSDLSGWDGADHGAALAAFRATCRRLSDHPPHARRLAMPVADLAAACRRALDLPADAGAASARAFFESTFQPVALVDDGSEKEGFFTGYFEPVVAASPVRDAAFPVPLYAPPDDLVQVKEQDRPAGWDPELGYARKAAAGLEPYPDRAEIEAGLLDGRGLELAFVGSHVEAFFIHVQGSVRLQMPDGSELRLTYAAKNGRPYSSIGRLLAETGAYAPKDVTMPVLRGWLEDNPEAGRELMRRNRSFIFFRRAQGLGPDDGPEGAAKVAMKAGTGIAVDRFWHLFGTPVWIDVAVADPAGGSQARWRNLMVAQDTGSAIVGPTRADIFTGSGEAAGAAAGIIRHRGRFVVLWPKPGQ
jgi:membrane-bound lytic murein transglycosylase A